jgi:hypothetical protein
MRSSSLVCVLPFLSLLYTFPDCLAAVLPHELSFSPPRTLSLLSPPAPFDDLLSSSTTRLARTLCFCLPFTLLFFRSVSPSYTPHRMPLYHVLIPTSREERSSISTVRKESSRDVLSLALLPRTLTISSQPTWTSSPSLTLLHHVLRSLCVSILHSLSPLACSLTVPSSRSRPL